MPLSTYFNLGRSRRGVRVLSVTLLLATTAPALGQEIAIMRVDGDAGVLAPPNFGNGWGQNAYRFLQDALDDAPVLLFQGADVVQIWVAATDAANPYRPDQNAEFGGGDETATFSLLNFVELYGGFLGLDNPDFPGTGEMSLMDRDPETNTTVLNGVLGFEFTPPCGDMKAGPCSVPNGTPGCDDPAC